MIHPGVSEITLVVLSSVRYSTCRTVSPLCKGVLRSALLAITPLMGGALGCGSSVDVPPVTTRVSPLNRDPLLSLRCRLVDVPHSNVALSPSEKVLGVGDSSHGTFWASNQWVYDDRGRVANQMPSMEAVAAVGPVKLLTVTGGQLRIHEHFSDAGRVLRPVPSACDLKILSHSAGAVVVYRQVRGACTPFQGGTVEVLSVDLSGQRIEVSHPFGLGFLRRLRSRWDNGRVILEAHRLAAPGTLDSSSDDNGWRSLVLNTEGAVLSDTQAVNQICPLVGCMTLSSQARRPLRFTLDNRRVFWEVSAPSGSFNTMATHGDRVLVVMRVANSEEYNLVLVDTVRRRAEAIYSETTRSLMETWQERISAESLTVVRTRRGFAYSGVNMQGELVAREIDCLQ